MVMTSYCLCCDENVPYNRVEREDKVEFTCMYCGFPLDVRATAENPRPTDLGYALIAEDSKSTRLIIEEALKESRFSACIVSFENGLELTSAYTGLLAEGHRVDIIILDLNMPVMGGITAARTLRTIELQKKHDKTPIVFFSAMKADEALRSHLENFAPAHYVNKGNDPSPEKLKERVQALIAYLMEKYRETA